jgi:hypothetical protein
MTDKSYTFLTFLKLLSVERVREYLIDIGIGIDDVDCLHVERFARACLETYTYAAMYEGLADSPELPSTWSRYRAVDGVLGDDELEARARESLGRDKRREFSCVPYVSH